MSLVQFRHRPLATSIFDEFFNTDWLPSPRYNSPVPAVNIQEGEKVFILELAVPGKSKNDFTSFTLPDSVDPSKLKQNTSMGFYELPKRRGFASTFKRIAIE